jgi:hypothetical protein
LPVQYYFSLTFGNIKPWQQKLSVANAALAPPRIADHTCEQISHEFNVFHKFLGRDVARQGRKSSMIRLQDCFIVIVESIKQLS